jgi:serine/threonine protein phosphatase PrpC
VIFRTASFSRAGGRPHNEDACGHLELAGASCWVVADGLGGHGGGDVASRVAVEAVLASFRDDSGLSPETLARHVERAHDAVVARRLVNPALSKMRSTLVLLVSDGIRARWAHLGDSRLYALTGGSVVYRTRDHSVVQALLAAGEIKPEQAAHHEDRNRLMRCLGQDEAPRPTISDPLMTLHHDDAFLLCTDGLWESITELELELDFAAAAEPAAWLTRIEQRVVHRARPGSDNYTALGVQFAPETLRGARE